MQNLRIKRQSNCIWSGTVNLGHPIIRRPPIQSICKSRQIKDPELGQFKVVRENNGYCIRCTLPIYLPFSIDFQNLWSRAIGGSPLNSPNLSLCPFIWNSHPILFAKFLLFLMTILETKNFKIQNLFLRLLKSVNNKHTLFELVGR